MRTLSGISLAILLTLHAPFSLAQQAAPAAASQQDLSGRMDKLLSAAYPAGQPGATVIVVKDGQAVLRKAYGDADVTKQLKMTPETVLRLGSITKQFTAVAIMLLVDSGKLALSDDITRFLPDYPTRGKKITVEHLLTHSSGIVSYTGRPGFREQTTRDLTVAQMIDSFKNDPLEFDPGTRFKYNNSGYFLLGAIIEKVSGMPYARFMEQRIFTPLGMVDTAYEGHERGKAARALGHSLTAQGFGPAAPLSMSQPYAAGALVSTVDDLARWDAAISAGKLLSAASWKKVFTPYVLADGKATTYGYGFGVDQWHGTTKIAHGGGINGFQTHALRLPQHNMYVAVLSNTDGGKLSADNAAMRIAAIALGKEMPERPTVTVEHKVLDTYLGNYQLHPGFVIAITRNGDLVFGQATGQPAFELKPVAQDRFVVEAVNAEVRFDKDAGGAVHQLTLFQHGREMPAARVK